MKVSKETQDAVGTILYVLVKANMLSRDQLRMCLQKANEEGPEDIWQWLIDDVKKLGGVGHEVKRPRDIA